MKEKINGVLPAFPNWGFSWPLIVGLVVSAGFLGFTHGELLNDPDSYLHISVGRWILLHDAIPSVDIFSYTKLGEPWIAHEWLAGLVLAICYQWAGWTGLVLLTVFVFAATLAYVLRYLLGRMEPIHALFFTALTYAALASHLLARPHVLAWPLLAIWACQLVQAVENQRRPPWWLLGVMVLWANLHGGFTLGLALEIPLFLEAVLSAPKQARWAMAKPWVYFMLASGLAAMATPSGWRGIWFTVQVMRLEHLQSVVEWMPPKSTSLWFLEGWLFLLLGMAVTGRLRMSLFRLLPLLGLLHLALAHERNVSIFALLAPFLVATPLSSHWHAATSQARQAETLDRIFRSLVPKANWPAVLVAGMAIAGTALFTVKEKQYQPAFYITPYSALHAAQTAHVEGRVFHDRDFGGFLIFHGIPVFTDGRADLYGDTFMEKYYEATVAGKPEKLPQLLDEYHVRWTLLQAGSPTAARLDGLPGWRRIYADRIAVVHKRELAMTANE